ncbi:DinB/UmuC family translesion DNA polymerase [Mycobacteroides abscessus]|uniref:DinB/UmuC family translesion DNA polymerase n=1 Tax=Mycobacteroides abscessus TaxID=36809 RepID=UPI0009A79901|nr:hypothetical protein [Mycobacteroides abscessus]MBN7457873.1 hypothetical protein [Mycobacteroides abscessus subsp. abscessus]SLC71926.1 Uncharacterised protein [Mycobacteroides abscessus subsp. massiliense]SLJ49668.1 Uncharacterised protein [Mycobacteroides abscessus subsp. abscessus]
MDDSSPSALATTDQDIMRHALTGYATTIARRLRRKQLQATVLTASASTSCYSECPGHHPYISQGFLQPTADTDASPPPPIGDCRSCDQECGTRAPHSC